MDPFKQQSNPFAYNLDPGMFRYSIVTESRLKDLEAAKKENAVLKTDIKGLESQVKVLLEEVAHTREAADRLRKDSYTLAEIAQDLGLSGLAPRDKIREEVNNLKAQNAHAREEIAARETDYKSARKSLERVADAAGTTKKGATWFVADQIITSLVKADPPPQNPCLSAQAIYDRSLHTAYMGNNFDLVVELLRIGRPQA